MAPTQQSRGACRKSRAQDAARVQAEDINADGVVVGWSVGGDNGGDSSPLKWVCTAAGCGTSLNLPTFAGNANYPTSINDRGDIVGTSGLNGVLYPRCGSPLPLNFPAGWHESYGWAVSDDGKTATGYSYPIASGKTPSRPTATRWALPAQACS